jgi:hypothetical protein
LVEKKIGNAGEVARVKGGFINSEKVSLNIVVGRQLQGSEFPYLIA